MPYKNRADKNAAARRRWAANPEKARAKCAAWKAAHPDTGRAARKRYKARLTAWLNEIKQAQGCIDCGTHDRLHFDHRPGTIKLFDPMRVNYGRAALAAEVAKCDVRCASCHTLRHAAERQQRAVV